MAPVTPVSNQWLINEQYSVANQWLANTLQNSVIDYSLM